MRSDIAEQIVNNFDYLIHDHGFAVASERHFESFGNWIIILQSDNCGRIRISQDRGEVFLDLGPQRFQSGLETGPWFNLDLVVRYLTASREGFETSLETQELQMQKLASALHKYIDQACLLFQSNEFDRHQAELETLRGTLERAVWNKYLSQD